MRTLEAAITWGRHCEEQGDEAIQKNVGRSSALRLLRFARNDRVGFSSGTALAPGGPRRWRSLLTFAALVLSSGAAFADCTGTPGVNILASAGQTCFASGAYVSTDVVAGQATGTGSVLTNVTEGGPSSVSFSTSAADTNAVQADFGGSVTLNVTSPSTGTITASGTGSYGVLATGTGSSMTGSGLTITATGDRDPITELGTVLAAVAARSGGVVTLNGGSISATGLDSNGVQAVDGGAATISGATVTTTNNGSVGLLLSGTGSSLTASNVAVSTQGAMDPANGYDSQAVWNGGGKATLTNVTAKTSGVGQDGVDTVLGGTTTINGGSITTTGDGSAGLGTANQGFPGGGTVNATNTTIVTKGSGADRRDKRDDCDQGRLRPRLGPDFLRRL